VRLRVHAPQITTTVGERPQAWPFARHQAQSGDVVTNPLHDKIEVEDGLCLALLALLDGTRDRAALAGDLAEAALRGKLISPPEGGSEVSLEGVREVIEKGIDANLNKLARMGLLIG
jgi:methyltransferase-like protein